MCVSRILWDQTALILSQRLEGRLRRYACLSRRQLWRILSHDMAFFVLRRILGGGWGALGGSWLCFGPPSDTHLLFGLGTTGQGEGHPRLYHVTF